jgi:hypothetical protein
MTDEDESDTEFAEIGTGKQRDKMQYSPVIS